MSTSSSRRRTPARRTRICKEIMHDVVKETSSTIDSAMHQCMAMLLKL